MRQVAGKVRGVFKVWYPNGIKAGQSLSKQSVYHPLQRSAGYAQVHLMGQHYTRSLRTETTIPIIGYNALNFVLAHQSSGCAVFRSDGIEYAGQLTTDVPDHIGRTVMNTV